MRETNLCTVYAGPPSSRDSHGLGWPELLLLASHRHRLRPTVPVRVRAARRLDWAGRAEWFATTRQPGRFPSLSVVCVSVLLGGGGERCVFYYRRSEGAQLLIWAAPILGSMVPENSKLPVVDSTTLLCSRKLVNTHTRRARKGALYGAKKISRAISGAHTHVTFNLSTENAAK